MQNENQSGELDMSTAENAFKSFFGSDTKPKNTPKQDDNPVDKILKQAEESKTPPNLKKVNAEEGPSAINEVSVEQAQGIVNQERTFKEILRDFKVNLSDLFAIIDSFLEKGYYEETHRIKNFEFTIRTKKIYSVAHTNDMLDGSNYTLATTAGHLLLERTIASSLMYFKLGEKGTAHIFQHETNEDDDKALEFIRSLHTPIYNILAKKVQRFELLTGLASRDEALDRFLELTQD